MAVISRRVSGVPKSGIREIFDLAQGMRNVINLGIGEPSFRTPAFVRQSAKKAIDSGFGQYTTNVGLLELRQEIAKKLKRENEIDVDPVSEIIVTAGATQAIFAVMNCLLDPGDEVLLPTPIFTAYKYAALLAGGVPIEVPTKEEEGYALDINGLEKSCSSSTKLLILNSPCNPTGSVLEKQEIEKACELAERNGLYILSDEIYEKYLYDRAKHFSPASLAEYRKRVITVNGFSKTWAMTGWRLGYAAAEAEIVYAMTRYNMYNAVCAPSMVQMAGITAMKHSLSFFKPILKEFEKKRNITCGYLDEMGWSYEKPRGAFYVFSKLPDRHRDSLSFSRQLLETGKVATIPGSSFGQSGEGHIRMSYALPEKQLKVGLDNLKEFAEK